MASFACRVPADRLALAAALIVAIAGCAGTPPAPTAYEAGVELPAGRGRDILVRSCLDCHDLGGLDLFKGFYSRDSWRDLVLTMQANGAEVDPGEVEIVSDYLATWFSPGTP